MSRPHAVLAAIAAAVALGAAACAPGANDELRTLVEGVVPAKSSMVECNWESNWGSGDIKALYGCVWLVPGSVSSVGSAVVTAANARGFTVHCDGNRSKLEVVGARGTDVLSMEVVDRAHIDAAQLDIPRGHVVVAVSAEKHESHQRRGSGPRCVS